MGFSGSQQKIGQLRERPLGAQGGDYTDATFSCLRSFSTEANATLIAHCEK
jgi:hypothetical protein